MNCTLRNEMTLGYYPVKRVLKQIFLMVILVGGCMLPVRAGTFTVIQADDDIDLYPKGISADGRVIAGLAFRNFPWFRKGFWWTEKTGVVYLPGPPGGSSGEYAHGISADGSTIFGHRFRSDGRDAVVWKRDGSYTLISGLEGAIHNTSMTSMSEDGSVGVGLGCDETGQLQVGLRWTQNEGFVELESFSTNYTWTSRVVLSDSGQVVVGELTGGNAYPTAVFRWTASGGVGRLADWASDTGYGLLYDCSHDGSLVVGTINTNDMVRSVVWTVGGRMEVGPFPPTEIHSTALFCSADGTRVLGFSQDGERSNPFIWAQTNGVQYINELAGDLGIDLMGYDLETPRDCSGNGSVIIGEISEGLDRRIYVLDLNPTPGVVFCDDFDGGQVLDMGVIGGFSGESNIVSVQNFTVATLGQNAFSGNFLHNPSGGYSEAPGVKLPLATTLTLENLPPHETLSLGFLLAIIDSWDGIPIEPETGAPDYLDVRVDGQLVFSHTFKNALNPNSRQSYQPPPDVLLANNVQMGFSNQSGNVNDSDDAYDMNFEPAFQEISHSNDTVVIEWVAAGAGWQGGESQDESWAIENVCVDLDYFEADCPRGMHYAVSNVYLLGLPITSVAPVFEVVNAVSNFVVSPLLPEGLQLDPVSGVLSGAPTLGIPQEEFTVTADTRCGPIFARFKFEVSGAEFTYVAPRVLSLNHVISPIAPVFSNGTVSVFSVSPDLPLGLELDPVSGVIRGIPRNVAAYSAYSVVANGVAQASLSFAVLDVPIQYESHKLVSYTQPANDIEHHATSLDMDGDFLVMGSTQFTPEPSGSLHQFRRDQGGVGTWGLQDRVTTKWPQTVAVHSNRLVVASAFHTVASTPQPSQITLYELDGVGGTNYTVELDPDPALTMASPLYWQVSDADIYGDWCVVSGHPYNPTNQSASRTVMLYQVDEGGSDEWGLHLSLFPPGSNSWGSSDVPHVSLSGDTLVVGASEASYVYERDQGGLNVWGHTFTISRSGSVSHHGDTLALVSAGILYVYERAVPGGGWNEAAELIPFDLPPASGLDSQPAVFDDRIVVGATNAGAAYVYYRDRAGPGIWGLDRKLFPRESFAQSDFGVQVAMHEAKVAVGAMSAPIDSVLQTRGGLYVYDPVTALTPSAPTTFYAILRAGDTEVEISTQVLMDLLPDIESVVGLRPAASGQAEVALYADRVTYQPNHTLVGADTLSFFLRDQHGVITEGHIQFQIVTDPSQVPQIELLAKRPPMQVQSRLNGVPGLTYRLQESADLKNPSWVDRGAVTADPRGAISLDVVPITSPAYYRVVYP